MFRLSWRATLLAGSVLLAARVDVVSALQPLVAAAYAELAPTGGDVRLTYRSSVPLPAVGRAEPDALAAAMVAALAESRRSELERGISLVGPHRDDWHLVLNGLDARSHASQGEQRTLALALRLAGHRLIASIVGSDPVLLLDDVFSELDPERSAALVVHLPATQTLLTTAGVIPPGIDAERHLTVHAGQVVA